MAPEAAVIEQGIATNYHVINGAYSIRAWDSKHKSYEVLESVIAYDETKDIAILKYSNKSSIPQLTLGNSDVVEQGDIVYAVGYPLGVANSYSDGVVSSRYVDNDGVDYIQVTAPISPGSSGGALFDDNGMVVGITTSSYINGQNMNLAIAANQISTLLGQNNNLMSLSELFDANTPYERIKEYLTQYGEFIDVDKVETVYVDYRELSDNYSLEVTYTEWSNIKEPGLGFRFDDNTNHTLDIQTGYESGTFNYCELWISADKKPFSFDVAISGGIVGGGVLLEASTKTMPLNELLNPLTFSIDINKGYNTSESLTFAQEMEKNNSILCRFLVER